MEALHVAPPSVPVQTSWRWESPQEGTRRAFPTVSGRPMVGIVGFLHGDRKPSHQSSVRRRRRQRHDHGIQRRVDRAHNLVHLGESSAARQALESANVAPETMATLRELTNPARRPPAARHALSQEIIRSEPVALQLDGEDFLTCLRTAKRGAAAGPSGMTADHTALAKPDGGVREIVIATSSED